VADTHAAAGLGGDGSALERAEATRWLAFVNSDVHPAFKPIFSPARYAGDESQHESVKAAARTLVRGLMESADKRLADNAWLAGFRSFADPYFYMTVRWAQGTGVDMAGLDNVAAFKARMDADDGVQAALKAEGLA
jgi:glutathione S-transferase